MALVKVAAYQAPLASCASIPDAIALIREQVACCESDGAEILCCPEGVLGGLADYAERPFEIALDVEGGELSAVLAPLASETVTTIVGFTEIDRGRLFNAAAVYHRGRVIGRYRKLHPAINRSIYQAGDGTPVFQVGPLVFGIVICRDSTFAEPARRLAVQGASVLFVPSNNGLPAAKSGAGLVGRTRGDDAARATENGMFVIRADVAGRTRDLVSDGSTAIVDPRGHVLAAARSGAVDRVVAEIAIGPPSRQYSTKASSG
jgi:predicted amidohydrolase